ncbi:uncharacterized protein BDZ99DRAFT_481012 [Mytilinidion resinicola]|uniref:Uncharacterized protein n=1 Tax=Mytilinidion resinicola TaxID=574789 RepID=A0A6A6Y6T1_9PEZI|nr:uncharacterized protein BDZ99DRAFT_481012 [Mytilinidion resinicola]KAF2804531.1 hypothetical protein BDZ99DRAFT_481012 [Mytilinidion resinicola]
MAPGQKRKYALLTRMSQIHVDGLIPQIAANWNQPSILDCIPAEIRYRIHDNNGKVTEEPENNPQNWGIQFLKELFDLSDHTKGRLEDVQRELAAEVRKRQEGWGGAPWLRDWDVIEVHKRFLKEAERKAEEARRADAKEGESYQTLAGGVGLNTGWTARAEEKSDADHVVPSRPQPRTYGGLGNIYRTYRRRSPTDADPGANDEANESGDDDNSSNSSEESSEPESVEDWYAPESGSQLTRKRLRLGDTHGAPLSLSPDEVSRNQKISDFFTAASKAEAPLEPPRSSIPPVEAALTQRVTRSMRPPSQTQPTISVPGTPPPAYEPVPRSANTAHTGLPDSPRPSTLAAFSRTEPIPPGRQPDPRTRPSIVPISTTVRRPHRLPAPLRAPSGPFSLGFRNAPPRFSPAVRRPEALPAPSTTAPIPPRLPRLSHHPIKREPTPIPALAIKPDPDTAALTPASSIHPTPSTPSLLRLEYLAAAAASRAAQLRLEMARQRRAISPVQFS